MLQVVPVKAFSDNYIWTLHDGGRAVVVDPGDAAPVHDYLASAGLALDAILITHHHGDHVGGVDELLSLSRVPVYGPAGEKIPGRTHALAEGDHVTLDSLGLAFAVIDVPGHTRGHIAYYGNGMLFCGDTLFACGCGRLFEGTPAQMHASLGKLAALPADTRVYCTHEYTLSNIRFARQVEPDNTALQERERSDRVLRESDLPTLPSTIGAELATNPFLRCEDRAVIAAATRRSSTTPTTAVEVFAAIREWKNQA